MWRCECGVVDVWRCGCGGAGGDPWMSLNGSRLRRSQLGWNASLPRPRFARLTRPSTADFPRCVSLSPHLSSQSCAAPAETLFPPACPPLPLLRSFLSLHRPLCHRRTTPYRLLIATFKRFDRQQLPDLAPADRHLLNHIPSSQSGSDLSASMLHLLGFTCGLAFLSNAHALMIPSTISLPEVTTKDWQELDLARLLNPGFSSRLVKLDCPGCLLPGAQSHDATTVQNSLVSVSPSSMLCY